MNFASSLDVAASGMDVEAERRRGIAANQANKDTTRSTPGADPYRRKTVTFKEMLSDGGDAGVIVGQIGRDPSEFEKKYDPSHPAADADGYVKLSNVNSFVELMDMREAERSYSANLNVMQVTRSMQQRTLDILK